MYAQTGFKMREYPFMPVILCRQSGSTLFEIQTASDPANCLPKPALLPTVRLQL